ncbi:hydrogenase nickel incorporation protein HypA/HybF [Streptomyces sp. Amel2xB2]|uniref:Hydrogenase maturation factor HypA n=1 Tax=Streptomyces nanshensis TaxID=518642 RepID=A0A1E7L3X8_9ACTN|nr:MULTISPECIES: hydrogenase maturation nickel metallochaperone HypA [Streptomyces]OEV10723.1 hydrogenase nickel incorporation protein HypA [Streptomyces nanshensis]RAJ59957.1 hydrogenase nickel incorporation protein HypA/HybF [Streptomyces sp. Amel2xB2]
MHEMSVAVAMVEQVTEAPAGDGHAKVSAVVLRLGELAGVVADSLRFCFSLACAGTVLEGAELLIDHVPGRARCAPCGAEWATGMPPQLCCPQCEGGRAELLAGREMQIVALRHGEDGPGPDPAGPVPVHAKES